MRRLVCLALLAALPACTEVGVRWYTARDVGEDGGDTGPSGPPTFAEHVRPILDGNGCLNCHGAAGGLSVDTPEALVSGGDSGPAVVPCRPDEGTLVAALTEHPPVGAGAPAAPFEPLPRVDGDLVARWIAAGAEQDVDCTEQGYDWERDIAPRFSAARCAEGFCHSDFAAGGLDLRTREGFFQAGFSGQPAVVPCDPGAGSLVLRLRPEAGFNRMPVGGPYLSEDDVLKVLAWIEQGAGQGCQ